MKAAQLIKYDEKEAVSIKDVEQPAPGEGQVLIEVRVAGVNPVDYKIREGAFNPPVPVTMGGDVAGVVLDVGSRVKNVKPGDEVYGMGGFYNGGTGAFAEYDVAQADNVALKPGSASDEEAGALPLAGVMALQMLEAVQAGEGKKILVQGGAGGIGSFAVQLAKHQGAHVAVTCSGDEIDYAKSLGADEAIDFRSQNFEDVLSGYDGVLDLVGGDVYRRSFRVLKPGGVIVSSLMPPEQNLMDEFRVKAVYVGYEITSERLSRLAGLVDEGAIKIHIDRTFPLEEADEAMTYLKRVHPRGKVVVRVK